jgi:GTPase SAR1 family protein
MHSFKIPPLTHAHASTTVSFFDVGGQRNERKKWIHYFEDVNAVMFVVALSEYDQNLFEDHEKNRMQEAITLFGDIANNKCFATSSIILFMNKKDLFEDKIRKVSIESCPEWADYTGKSNDYDDGCAYFERKFVEQVKDPLKEIVTHFTCATNTDNVQVVFNSCKKAILMANLSDSGFAF